ncbi:MAG: phosphoribosyl-AMP cyclohydrolase [Pseudomonadota bacterium]
MASCGGKATDETDVFTPRFDASGLIVAVTTDAETGQILMVAYMNEEALKRTLETKDVWYWSRSRQKLWRKGETSGHTQKLREILVDCDQDALEVRVDQTGAACHTGRRSCFYRRADGRGKLVFVDP